MRLISRSFFVEDTKSISQAVTLQHHTGLRARISGEATAFSLLRLLRAG
jgi:hypothetical protein